MPIQQHPADTLTGAREQVGQLISSLLGPKATTAVQHTPLAGNLFNMLFEPGVNLNAQTRREGQAQDIGLGQTQRANEFFADRPNDIPESLAARQVSSLEDYRKSAADAIPAQQRSRELGQLMDFYQSSYGQPHQGQLAAEIMKRLNLSTQQGGGGGPQEPTDEQLAALSQGGAEGGITGGVRSAIERGKEGVTNSGIPDWVPGHQLFGAMKGVYLDPWLDLLKVGQAPPTADQPIEPGRSADSLRSEKALYEGVSPISGQRSSSILETNSQGNEALARQAQERAALMQMLMEFMGMNRGVGGGATTPFSTNNRR